MLKYILSAATQFRALYTGRYAVVTNTLTAGSLSLIDDAVAQYLEIRYSKSNQKWNKERCKNMTFLGTVFAPALYYWYRLLDTKFPGKSRQTVLRKILLDMGATPVVYLLYFGAFCKLNNYSREKSIHEMSNKIPIILSIDVIVWPLFQTVNFSFFPPHYRIIGMKINELILGVIFSHLINSDYTLKQIKDGIKRGDK